MSIDVPRSVAGWARRFLFRPEQLTMPVGRLSGEGGLTLAQGRFADKQTGVDLRDISARITFGDDAARRESSASSRTCLGARSPV